jgi:hypothetical protein
MPITVRIDQEAGIRFNEVSGSLTLDELLSTLREIYSQPDFDPDLNVLWDLRNSTVEAFAFEEAKYTADFVGDHWGVSGSSRAAFVVSKDEHYGLARMYEQLLRSRSSSKVMVFRDFDEAVSWLTEA